MKKHLVIKNAVDPILCNFLHRYLLSKKFVLTTLLKHKYISPFSQIHGSLEGDPQII